MHRDIKPANVLVARNGYATLVDFGLAKLPDQSAINHSAHGSQHPVGLVVGTVPPCRRNRPWADTSIVGDVFSFGVMLYELVARHRPFEGPTDLHVLS